ncbi:MAG: hypothetical protein WBD23_08265, partial [Candidatus Acidiferrales bacterium]
MDAPTTLIVLVLVLVLVGGPVVAIVGLVRVRRLEDTTRSSALGIDSSASSGRLRALEQRIAGIEKALGQVIARVDALSQAPAHEHTAAPPRIPIAPPVAQINAPVVAE